MKRNAVAGVTIVAVLIASLVAISVLVEADWDPTIFATFGSDEPMTLAYAEERLGREVLTRRAQGHDGKFFFVQANDPWLLDPEANAEIIGNPLYRSQRMLYPVLAGGGGLLSPEAILWMMILVNVAFAGLGSWAVARIAQRHGVSVWVGLAFVLNVGLLFELSIDGAGIVAFSLACVGAWALEEDRTLMASIAFVASALTREVMLVFVGSVVVFWLVRRKQILWRVALPPVIAVVAWAVYLRIRINPLGDVTRVDAVTLTPFAGLIEALTSQRALFSDYAVILLFVSLIIVVPIRAWRSSVYLTWGAVGFAILGPFLTVFVWQKSFDISRALAPLVTVFVLEFLLARQRDRKSRAIDT